MTRNVLVMTGDAGPTGCEILSRAATAGYAVAIACRRGKSEAQKTVESLERQGLDALMLPCARLTGTDMKRVFREVDQELGPVTAAVHFFDCQPSDDVPFTDLNGDTLLERIGDSATAGVTAAREALRRMARGSDATTTGSEGVFIGIAELGASSQESGGRIEQAILQGMIERLMDQLAAEFAPQNIRVESLFLDRTLKEKSPLLPIEDLIESEGVESEVTTRVMRILDGQADLEETGGLKLAAGGAG